MINSSLNIGNQRPRNAPADLRPSVMPERFETPRRLPEDTAEYVFIWNACEVIGEVLHGTRWTGKERTSQVPPLLPDCIDPIYRQGLLTTFDTMDENVVVAEFDAEPAHETLVYAERLLKAERPDLTGQYTFNALAIVLNHWTLPRTFTVKEWRIAQELAALRRLSALETRRRWVEVAKKIKEFCEAGQLRTVLRGLDGGPWSAVLDRSMWNFEYYEARIAAGQMCIEVPYRFSQTHPRNQWIFVSNQTLQSCLRQLTAKQTVVDQGIQPGFISDQMAFMISVATATGITAENPQNKLYVEQCIRDNWLWHDVPSDGDVKWMGTLIRNRQAKGGRDQRRYGHKKAEQSLEPKIGKV